MRPLLTRGQKVYEPAPPGGESGAFGLIHSPSQGGCGHRSVVGRSGDEHDAATSLDVGVAPHHVVDLAGRHVDVQDGRATPQVRVAHHAVDRVRVGTNDVGGHHGCRRRVIEAKLDDGQRNETLSVLDGAQKYLLSGFRL